jgi:deoxycytidine triphosphate deaminase
MKKVLSTIVAALIALSFSAVVFAADTTSPNAPASTDVKISKAAKSRADEKAGRIKVREKARADAAAKNKEATDAKLKANSAAVANAREASEAKGKAKAGAKTLNDAAAPAAK